MTVDTECFTRGYRYFAPIAISQRLYSACALAYHE